MSPKRHSPIRHTVERHERGGRLIQPYKRGKGTKTQNQRRSRVVGIVSKTSGWFKKLVVNALYDKMKKWQQEFPDEGVDPEYMTLHFASMFPYVGDPLEEGAEKVVAFTLSALRDGRVAYRSYPSSCAIEKRKGACYYNSADLVRRDPEAELAFGVLYEREDPLNNPLAHAFVVKDGKIIDPTVSWSRAAFMYVYETVPRSVWSKWRHLPGDPDYDAREFEKYAWSRYDKYSGKFDIVNELEKVIERERKSL